MRLSSRGGAVSIPGTKAGPRLGWGLPWLLAALALVLASAPSAVAPARASVGYWSEPVNLSNTPLVSWFPDVAVDSMGVLHTVWADGGARDPDVYDYLYYSRYANGAWSKPIDIATSERGWVNRSAIAVASGMVHVLFRDTESLYYMQARADAPISARSWSEPQRIDNGGAAYMPSIAVDDRGRVHLAWTEGTSLGSNRYQVWYRFSDDAGASWNPPVALSEPQADRNYVQLLLAPDGTLHAVWQAVDDAGERTGAVHRALPRGAAQWSPLHLFTPPAGRRLLQTTLAVDRQGALLAVWRLEPGEERFYQTSRDNGATWSAPRAIPGPPARAAAEGRFDIYSLASDADGHLHLLWVGRLPGAEDRFGVYHNEWDGAAWSPADLAAAVPGFPEFPRAVVGLGNQLHVLFFSRDQLWMVEGQRYNFEVWYVHTTTGAAALAPAPYPAAAAAAIPTPALATPAATAVALPTPLPDTLPPAAALESEWAASFPVVIGVVAAAAVLALVAGARWMGVLA